MKPGDIAYADIPEEILGMRWWRVEILGKPHHGNVLVRWLEGPLMGREARLVAKTVVKEKR